MRSALTSRSLRPVSRELSVVRPRRRDGGSNGRARPLPRLDRGRRAIRPLRVIVVDQNEDERARGDRSRTGLRARAPTLRARVSRVRATRALRTSTPISSPSPTTTASTRRGSSSASRSASRGPRPRRSHRTRGGRRWALVGIVEDRPALRSPTTTSGTGRSRSRSSSDVRSCERVGAFDERLGLGSREPWSSGEEIDYLDPRGAFRSADRIRPVTRRPTSRAPGRLARSARATGRASATCCASTAIPPGGRTNARAPARRHARVARSPRWLTGRVPARDVPRPRSRLPRREALEQLGVTVEPGLECEPFDRPRASGRRVRG